MERRGLLKILNSAVIRGPAFSVTLAGRDQMPDSRSVWSACVPGIGGGNPFDRSCLMGDPEEAEKGFVLSE